MQAFDDFDLIIEQPKLEVNLLDLYQIAVKYFNGEYYSANIFEIKAAFDLLDKAFEIIKIKQGKNSSYTSLSYFISGIKAEEAVCSQFNDRFTHNSNDQDWMMLTPNAHDTPDLQLVTNANTKCDVKFRLGTSDCWLSKEDNLHTAHTAVVINNTFDATFFIVDHDPTTNNLFLNYEGSDLKIIKREYLGKLFPFRIITDKQLQEMYEYFKMEIEDHELHTGKSSGRDSWGNYWVDGVLLNNEAEYKERLAQNS